MKVIADTNVLLRVTLGDDPKQQRQAQAILLGAELIAISTPTLCEFCWVLAKSYKRSPSDIARAIRQWLDVGIVAVDRGAAEAGLRLLESGGDFADGAIAYQGRQLGGDVFVTFDKHAAELISKAGGRVEFLKSKA